jgi:hypothetical protein
MPEESSPELIPEEKKLEPALKENKNCLYLYYEQLQHGKNFDIGLTVRGVDSGATGVVVANKSKYGIEGHLYLKDVIGMFKGDEWLAVLSGNNSINDINSDLDMIAKISKERFFPLTLDELEKRLEGQK